MAHDSTEDRTLKRRHPRIAHFLAAVLVLAATTAPAQDYPNRPIRFIVPYPPGGGTDVVARVMNEALAADLGQPIIIDNRGGAAGNVGTDLAAKAPADGYHILFTLSSHTINPKLYDKLPFDVERDFVPVSLAAMIPQILVVHPSVPANNVKELIALAKANPGKLNYASVGTGSPGHIAGELFKIKTGVDIVHIPYKGGGPAVIDTIGGQVQLKAIAVASAQRSVAAPDVPTIAESGVPDYAVESWYGAFAPAKTPPAAVARLNAAFTKVLQNREVKEKLLAQGAEATSSTQAELDRVVKDELVKWDLVIKTAKIRPD
jgi:tripartite-type tricarboxylate transporter receptor subunit TctC